MILWLQDDIYGSPYIWNKSCILLDSITSCDSNTGYTWISDIEPDSEDIYFGVLKDCIVRYT